MMGEAKNIKRQKKSIFDCKNLSMCKLNKMTMYVIDVRRKNLIKYVQECGLKKKLLEIKNYNALHLNCTCTISVSKNIL